MYEYVAYLARCGKNSAYPWLLQHLIPDWPCWNEEIAFQTFGAALSYIEKRWLSGRWEQVAGPGEFTSGP